ncbi:MAG: hypothetical protein AB8B87_20230 [Granulosicoccus sp.]
MGVSDYADAGYPEVETLERISPANPILGSTTYELNILEDLPDQLMPDVQTDELHRFTLTIEFSDGKSFSIDTDAMLISGED